MNLLYNLKLDGKEYSIEGEDFDAAVEKIELELKIEIPKNRIRISSVLRLE